MRTKVAAILAFVLTACMGSFTIIPKSDTSATPGAPSTVMLAGNPMPSASATVVQASATPQAAMSTGPSAAPTSQPMPTQEPKKLWTQVVPGVEVMDESALDFRDAKGNLIKPRRVSGIAMHTGAPGTAQAGMKELWVQFNQLPIELATKRPCDRSFRGGPNSYACSSYYTPGFVAYDTVTSTWSLRAMSPDLGCSRGDRDIPGAEGSQYENFHYIAPCHPDDYQIAVNQYAFERDFAEDVTFVVDTPIVTAQGSQSFTVDLWSRLSTMKKAPVATVPITNDFARVLHTPDSYASYKEERGVSPTGHSAWYNDRLYTTTQYRNSKGLSTQEWSNLPRVIAWWSKSDSSWRVTELPFAKNEEVRGTGALRPEQPLYMAIDPNSGVFFFVVPDHLVQQVYGNDRIEYSSRPVPFSPRRLWGTLVKVSASFIHDNGVPVSMK